MSKKTLDPQVQAAVDALQAKVYADPQIRAYINDTLAMTHNDPNSDANKSLMSQRSATLTQMVQAKGYLPQGMGNYTLDPSNGNMIRHGGWAGLSGAEKATIIAVAAAATGVGVLGAAGLLAGGAATAAGGTSAGAGLAGIATPAVTAGVGGIGAGTTAAVSAGTGFAGLLGRVATGVSDASKIATGVTSALNGGATPQTRGAVAANAADQAAANRLKETQIAQNGPTVDAQALANVRKAGTYANYTPPPPAEQALFDKYGKRVNPVDPTTMQFAGSMQQQLAARLAAGQPLTLSGVPAPGAQEVADAQTARNAAMNPNGTGVAGAVATGASLAKLAPSFLDLFKQFGYGGTTTSPQKPIRLGVPQDMYGDPGPING